MSIFIFGKGLAAEVAASLIMAHESSKQLVGFCVDDEYYDSDNLLGLPTFRYSDLKNSEEESTIFVANGYANLNRFREKILERVMVDGFSTLSINSEFKDYENIKIGTNCMIVERSSIQPHVKIGNNVFIWSGSTICHHCELGDNIWVTAGAVIAGNTKIGSNVFIGANATITSGIEIGDNCFIGAGVLIDKDLKSNSVVIKKGDKLLAINSESFIKFLDQNRKY
jgi:sugar O-acyltransferase (sialic acid O-acetyltransferase NeuD family)